VRRRALGDALGLALEAGVERLALFHHAPDRSDDALDALLEETRAEVARRGAPLDVIAAAEGMTVEV
jgi:ribonuclease BN (tRNA processing enzyme)